MRTDHHKNVNYDGKQYILEINKRLVRFKVICVTIHVMSENITLFINF